MLKPYHLLSLLALSLLACEVEVGVEPGEDQPLVAEDAEIPPVDEGLTPEPPDQGIIEVVMCHDAQDCQALGSPINCLGDWRCDPDELIPGDYRGPGGCVFLCEPPPPPPPGCQGDQDCPPGTHCLPCGPNADCAAPSECRPIEEAPCATDEACAGRPAPLRCPGVWFCDASGSGEADFTAPDLCAYRCDDPRPECRDDADCPPNQICVSDDQDGDDVNRCAPLPPLCLEDADCAGRQPPIWCQGAWTCAAETMVEADFRDMDGCIYTCDLPLDALCDVDADCGPNARCLPCDDPACEGQGRCAPSPEGCRDDADCGPRERCDFCDGPHCDLGVCVPIGVEPWVCRVAEDCADQDTPLGCLGEWACDPEGLQPADYRGEGGCAYHCGIVAPCAAAEDCAPGEVCLEGRCAPAPLCAGPADCANRPAPIRCVGDWSCDPEGAQLADFRAPDGCIYTCATAPEPCVDDAACPRGQACVEGVCVEAPLVCEIHEDCADHPAPIRCVGVWRCDPQHRSYADARGEDGCDYTCEFNLRPCADDAQCPPTDVCAPCVGDACQAPGQCVPGERALTCEATPECFDHPAPIRCPGAWRCDPLHQHLATARGEDGCDYTCFNQLRPCRADFECAGDVCAPCPLDGACPTPSVCMPPEEAYRCDDRDLSRCEGLAHDDCVGGWTCQDSQCAWLCDHDQDRPEILMNACEPEGFVEGCCSHDECRGGFCQALGFDAQGAYCGGMGPPPINQCVRDGCQADIDCGESQVCVLAGTHGYVLNTCMRAACQLDAHCRDGGACLPFFHPCYSYGFACVYPGDPCRVDADCPQERAPMLCLPNEDGHGTRCVEDMPRP
ncbi:hypothetical protein KKF91_16525 [Myxococcota bacterium]|nr:hypothetical protein [Myxococcota bacterium]